MISKKDKYNSDKILDVEKTHLVYTINSLRKTGPVNVLGSMIKYIDHNNYKVSIVAFLPGDAPGKVIASNPDVSYTCLNLSSKLDIITKGPKALEELLSVSRVDIVHSHGILANIASYKSNSAYNHVATIHNSIFEDYRYTFGRLKGFLFAQWHLYYLRKFEKVVCCSKTSYRQVQKYLPNAQSITNGNDLMTLKTNSETIAATRRALGIAKNDIAYIYIWESYQD